MHGDAAAAAAAPQGERGRRPAEDAWAEQAAQAFQEPNNAGAMLDPGFGVGGVQLLQEGCFRSRTEEQLDASTDFACAPPVPPCLRRRRINHGVPAQGVSRRAVGKRRHAGAL